MFRKSVLISAVLSIVMLSVTVSAQHNRQLKNSDDHDKMMRKNKIINKYVDTQGGTTLAGWKDNALFKSVKQCGANFSCSDSWGILKGKVNSKLTEFYKDGLTIYEWAGLPRWVMSFISESFYGDVAWGALFHNVPKAADLIADSIKTKDRLYELYGKDSGQPYWVLFYLGAKNKINEMITGLEEIRSSRSKLSHIKAFLISSSAWKLSPKDIKAIETFCIEKVFQESDYENAVPHCLRWLGVTGTKNSNAKKYIKKYIKSGRGYEAIEASRAAGMIKDTGSKSTLQEILEKSYYKKSVYVGRKNVQTDAWHAKQTAVATAIALAAMGDAKGKKAIKWWLTYDAKTADCDHTAIDLLFLETAISSPAIQKMMKNDLKSIYNKIKTGMNKKGQLKQVYLRASLALLQMGDKTGMKVVTESLENAGNNKEILEAFGSEPEKSIGQTRPLMGRGHIKVGKDGLSIGDAKKLLKAIQDAFSMWSSNTLKGYGFRAWLDLRARIQIAEKKL